jgi:hypothetical protein
MTTALTPNQADYELKRSRALTLRARHATYRQIALALGCDVATAYRLVQSGLKELREDASEAVEEIKQLELERLDDLAQMLQAKLDRQIIEVQEKDQHGVVTGRVQRFPNPDEATIKAMLDVMRRRADLMGLDAPKQIGAGGDPLPPGDAGDAREILLQRVTEMAARIAAAPLTPVEVVSSTVPPPQLNSG